VDEDLKRMKIVGWRAKSGIELLNRPRPTRVVESIEEVYCSCSVIQKCLSMLFALIYFIRVPVVLPFVTYQLHEVYLYPLLANDMCDWK
jgi:hypothetical protein